MARRGWWGVLISALLSPLATASARETFELQGTPYKGRAEFVFVGASLTDNTGRTNGVNCIKSATSATVRPRDLPAGRHLVSATLYIGGSLIDDGEDYDGVTLFANPDNLQASDELARPTLEALALESTDRTVSFKPPGAAAPVSVTASEPSAVTVFYELGRGNLAFTVTRIDVTDIINNQGRGLLDGDYVVSDFTGDVCRGREVVCAAPGETPRSCFDNPGSEVHPYGAASFALLLVVEDPSLPLRTITTFTGIKSLSDSSITEHLTLENPISDPPSGSLAFYALEGDIGIPAANVDVGPCHASESIEVDGDADTSTGGLCLEDSDNPRGNLFNSTINVEPATAAPDPACPGLNLCCGPGLCGTVGVDIDRFPISSALRSGNTDVRVTARSGQDRVYLAVMVLGIEVFEPVLQANSQIRVLTADPSGYVQIGGPLIYSIAISNTGNVDAFDAAVRLEAPASTRDFTILVTPPGATDESDPLGGSMQTGIVDVRGFDVPAGEIAEVRLQLTTTCAPGAVLTTHASVTARDLAPFQLAAPQVILHGPGVEGTECEKVEPAGPFAPELASRVLRGGGVGGGCGALDIGSGSDSDTGTGSGTGGHARFTAVAALLALGALAWMRRRRQHRHLVVAGTSALVLLALPALALALTLAVTLALGGCGKRHETTVPPEEDHSLKSLDGLPGEPCGTSPLMVVVTDADGARFCIDRFEAAVDGGSLGNAHQGLDPNTLEPDDELMTLDGSTGAAAVSELAVYPTPGLSWYQAKAACANAGKRLCTVREWERACRGPDSFVYPYGDTMDEHACQGFFNYPEENPARTGSLESCGSAFGAYDMSGNLEEWVEDAVERIPGSGTLDDRAIRGGSFKSNANALACVGPEFHEPPGGADIDRGFRCCTEAP